jgi:hypothetical protein
MVKEFRRSASALALIFISASLSASGVLAFQNSLSEESVREAYFLGRGTDSEKLNRFLQQYVRNPKSRAVGPVSLRTPYHLAVLRALQNGNYNAQQAQIDYQARPGLMVISFSLYPGRQYPRSLSPTAASGPAARTQTDVEQWRAFRFKVSQSAAIRANALASRPIFHKNQIIGAEIDLEFQARQFAQEPTEVQITTPEGEIVTAQFNLDQLN